MDETRNHLQQQRSGRLLLRLPPDLHTRVASEAAAHGKSLNRWLLEVLVTSLPDDTADPAAHPATRAARASRG
ncbi:type II toxin-antitoxin system HicB family antitoxin [Schlegelella sp. S2-27]|uniref:Type II toxin-antitoxin system HicB family antitoxin n=1 Tax=Caldimonas mangrovi TaxID=2944811 RepID=A0ABT0YV72_9BURK|nr:toxin-antitoxin system HicB family antitoxin [Caldimonas mangrovi]MCM5682656.1 type II toxin-antitoxin system HicB family antitoxin [Caldimonas mangrovi]